MHVEHPHLIESTGFASAKARLKLMPACLYGHGRRAKRFVVMLNSSAFTSLFAF